MKRKHTRNKFRKLRRARVYEIIPGPGDDFDLKLVWEWRPDAAAELQPEIEKEDHAESRGKIRQESI